MLGLNKPGARALAITQSRGQEHCLSSCGSLASQTCTRFAHHSDLKYLLSADMHSSSTSTTSGPYCPLPQAYCATALPQLCHCSHSV